MSETRMEEGDIVDIHFGNVPDLKHVEIITVPSDTRDSWTVLGEDGVLHKVMFFELMTRVRHHSTRDSDNSPF